MAGSSSRYATGTNASAINKEPGETEESCIDKESLISMITGAEKTQQASSNAQMQKVPAWMRKYPRQNEYFDPEVVALGPFHGGESHLKHFQKIKLRSFRAFVDSLTGGSDGQKKIDVVEKLCTTVAKALNDKDRKWGAKHPCAAVAKEVNDKDLKSEEEEAATNKRREEAFTCMMVVDGCFILQFIEWANEKKAHLNISELQIPLIVRDMFLLENQIPFSVLRSLSKLRNGLREDGFKKQICQFIHSRILLPSFYSLSGRSRSNSWSLLELLDSNWNTVAHLLDVLRVFLLGKSHRRQTSDVGNLGEPQRNSLSNGSDDPLQRHQLGSVMELQDSGIRFSNSEEMYLTNIEFKKNWVLAEIRLPPIVVTKISICYMLNMISLEHHLNIPPEESITSYTSFLSSVVNNKKDVKELRQSNVLHHALGSDKEVAELLNYWPIEAMGDLPVHTHVSNYINDRSNWWKISIARFVYTHFRSPWSAISTVVGAIALMFTLLQTIFAVIRRSEGYKNSGTNY